MEQPPPLPRRRPLTETAHDYLRQAIATAKATAPEGTTLRAVDATAGNGHDTLFLARLLGAGGEVAAFDIQQTALDNTALRLREAAAGNTPQPIVESNSADAPHAVTVPASPSRADSAAVNPAKADSATSGSPSPDAKEACTPPAADPATTAAGTLANVRLCHASHAQMPAHLPENWRGAVTAITFNLGYLPGGDKAIVTLANSTLPAIEAALQLLAPGGLISILCYRGHSEGATETNALLGWLQERLPHTAGGGLTEEQPFSYRCIEAAPEAPSHAPLLLHIYRAQPQRDVRSRISF